MTGNPADCPNYSGLAAGNGDQFACTQLATTSINNPSCTVPFGTLYTRGNNGLIALLGVYSHIVAGGSSLCQGGTLTYTYITELWFLDEFATSVLGYPIDVMSGYDATTQSGTSLHSDNPPKTIDMNGKSMFTGDVYVWEPNTVDDNNDNGSDSDKGSSNDNSKNENPPVVTSPQPVSSTSSSKPFATNDSNDDKSKSDKTSNDKGSDDPSDSNDDNNKSTKGDSDDNGDETTEDEMAMGEKEISMLTETKYISGDKTSDEDSSMDGLADNKQDEKSSPNEMSNQQANLSDDGLNKTQIIVIAIVVPVVTLFFGFVVYILFRMWKSKQIDEKPWDPLAEANHHREAIFDLGGLGIDSTTTPPPYARHSESASSINIRTPCSSLSKQECISKEYKT
ncbi:hypothetical protein FB645_004406 [Coemansia sp. IMI 203386]|nr:hypothetical protein FB645_004406 [Coemansia sp. IMI 203386]